MAHDTPSGNPVDSTMVIKEKLKELIRYAARSRLEIHAACDEVELSELGDDFNPGRILANNMVFILVSGDMLRVTFKAHFNMMTARTLAYRVFGGRDATGVSEKQATDYFKEYGNLVAGSIVTLFEPMEIGLGMSLPLCTRGFYEIFSDYSEKDKPTMTFSDFWQLQVQDSTVYCSAAIEVLDVAALAPLKEYEIVESAASDDEEMDFL